MELIDVAGFEGLYAVSKCGKVISRARMKRIGGVRRSANMVPVIERELKQVKDRRGYPCVNLSKDGASKMFAVHRLVACAWLWSADPSRRHVNHKNGVKSDNRVDNLEWCSPAENLRHAVLTGLHLDAKGENNPKSKLTVEQVADIRSRQNYRGLIKALAEEFGVGRLCIGRIRRGVTWV